jgi:hypothetical protein
VTQDIESVYAMLPYPNGDACQRFETYKDALAAADGNPKRVWFLRHDDGDDDQPDDIVWTVELYHGQYVNFAGFMVSVDPCKPEHEHDVFEY